MLKRMLDQRVSRRSVTQATFVIQRHYPAAPARVFAAFADPAAKSRWFMAPDTDTTTAEYSLDFRVGGRELSRGTLPDGSTYVFDACYQDIVADQRIVTTYQMQLDANRISVSLATVELAPDGSGTRLVYTEHGAYLDGHDTPAARERGTIELLDALAAFITS
jgi:uncharacterized protein YndB with AHSA1/START domain